ncbi:MarR family transcriptional regulator [Streptomyces sp. NPDC126497]|uniref:MarR family winged helix-turn-helix transcriptional regulator n=1 Tax=Streptomyces sp. NPDC126497 TaxID=3155313 RepID=UPI00331B5572
MPGSHPSDQDLSRVARELTAILPTLNRAVDRRLAQDVAMPKPPEGQLALLRLVAERDGIAVREAADVMLMKPNNVSALVSQMTRQGLLERRQDAHDKRVAHLHLTVRARQDLARVDDLRHGYVTEALHTLTDGDLDAIGSALSALSNLARRLHPAH